MALVDDLKAAKALIDTPEKWGKNSYEPAPGQFCALGALDRACGSGRSGRSGRWCPPEVEAALQSAVPPEFNRMITAFNDHDDTTHADIMALFDRAIDLAALSTAESGK